MRFGFGFGFAFAIYSPKNSSASIAISRLFCISFYGVIVVLVILATRSNLGPFLLLPMSRSPERLSIDFCLGLGRRSQHAKYVPLLGGTNSVYQLLESSVHPGFNFRISFMSISR